MAVPSFGGINPVLGPEFYEYIKRTKNLRNWSLNKAVEMRAGTITYFEVVTMPKYLFENRVEIQRIAAISGIAEYAADELNTPTFDLAADHTTMIAALDAIRTWLAGNIPVGNTSISWVTGFDSDNNPTLGTVATGTIEPLAALLDTLNATIDAERT